MRDIFGFELLDLFARFFHLIINILLVV